MYGKPVDPDVKALARESFADVMRSNRTPAVAQFESILNQSQGRRDLAAWLLTWAAHSTVRSWHGNAKSPYVTAKQLTNLYCEVRPDGEKSALVAYGTPGLSLFVDMGDTPVRGGRAMDSISLAFFVHRGTLYEVNNAGVTTARGALLTTTGRVSMSDNGVQLMIVTAPTATSTTPARTHGLPTSRLRLRRPQSTRPPLPYLGRRFVVSFNGSGRFYCSAIDDGLTWDPLNFASAEVNPDPIAARVDQQRATCPVRHQDH